MEMDWMRRKPIELDHLDEHRRLKPTLNWWHRVGLGVGAVAGTGIYTLVGVGADLAGPGVAAAAITPRWMPTSAVE